MMISDEIYVDRLVTREVWFGLLLSDTSDSGNKTRGDHNGDGPRDRGSEHGGERGSVGGTK